MRQQLNTETESKILEAAKQVFTEKGLEMAKMSDIANAAGISRTSLNYYYRTKENLFQAIIGQVASLFWPDLASHLEAELPVREKIKGIIQKYNTILIENPLLPYFMSIEIRRDPNQLIEILKTKMGGDAVFKDFKKQIEQEMADGKIKKMPLSHMIVTISSLSVFPFLMKPLLELVFFKNNAAALKKFIDERQNMVIDLVMKFLEVD